MLSKKILGWWYKLRGITPAKMPMVQYWMFKEAVEAKVTTKDGAQIMVLEGEKYPISHFPRAHVLFGKLSKLKHEIKNQIFNASWQKIESGIPAEQVAADIKELLRQGIKVKDTSPLLGREYTDGEDLLKLFCYDTVPWQKMSAPVREIWRAWTKIGVAPKVKELVCVILQEDDSYKYRVQWLAEWFPFWMKLNPAKYFETALNMLEHAEVVGDMKERIRLLRRILLVLLKDKEIRTLFNKLFREIDWKKVKLTKGDKYHLRAKHFKCDYGIFSY